MEPQQSSQNTPLGQPVTPNPTDPQYVPQPLNSASPAPNKPSRKSLWMVIAGMAVILALLVGLFFMQSSSAKSAYTKEVANFKQEIKTARDALNTELDEKNISGRSAQAKSLFEDHGKKIEAVAAKKPKAPKVLGVIPVSVDKATKDEAEALHKAASDYAQALRHDFSVYNYYKQATDKFKPIKDLGTITAKHEPELRKLNELWPEYTSFMKTLQPPKGLESMHADVIAQAEAFGEKLKPIVDNYETTTIEETDKLVSALRPLTDKLNKTFIDGVDDAAVKSYDAINTTYDALDERLK